MNTATLFERTSDPRRTTQARPYRLGDRFVTSEMYHEAHKLKTSGKGVRLLVMDSHLDELARDAAGCGNCDGTGWLGLSVITGGPWQDVPHRQSEPGDGARSGVYYDSDPKKRGWYTCLDTFYHCPVCSPVREIAL